MEKNGRDIFNHYVRAARKLNTAAAVKRKPVTDKDINNAYITMAAIGYLIFKMDDLRHTSYYQKILKKKGEVFLDELMKVESKIIDIDIFDSQDKVDKANAEMNDSYIYFENMINVIFNVPEERMDVFNKYMEIGLEMYSS